MDVPLLANLEQIRDRRQQLIDENLIRQNEKWIQHQYHVGEKINIEIWNKTKISRQLEGPFTIMVTRTYGTVDF